jgi:hypothetical protein
MIQSRPLLGIALNLAAVSVFPFLDTVAKTLGHQGVPVFEIVCRDSSSGLSSRRLC